MKRSAGLGVLVVALALIGSGVASASQVGSRAPAGSGVVSSSTMSYAQATQQCGFASVLTVDDPSGPKGLDPETGALLDKPVVTTADCASPNTVGGTVVLTKTDPNYVSEDTLNRLSASVTTYSGSYPMQWSYTFKPALQNIIVGVVKYVKADRKPPNCSYYKTGEPANYYFHWGCPSQTANVQYTFNGSANFVVDNGSGGKNVTQTWQLVYTIKA